MSAHSPAPRRLDRRQLLKIGAAVGTASLIGVDRLAPSARAASTDFLPGDLGSVKILATAALVGAGYYKQAAATTFLDTKTKSAMKAALADQEQHHKTLAAILTSAGLPAPTNEDTFVEFPKKVFRNKKATVDFGIIVERLIVRNPPRRNRHLRRTGTHNRRSPDRSRKRLPPRLPHRNRRQTLNPHREQARGRGRSERLRILGELRDTARQRSIAPEA